MWVTRRMSLVLLGLLTAIFLFGCGSQGGVTPIAASASLETFTANLDLAQEVPAPTIPVGAVPSGSGSVTLDPVTKVLTGSFTTVNVVGATAAHIHDGDIGVAGPVVVPLLETPVGSGIWVVAAAPVATVLNDLQIARLRAGGFYVNVHTALNLTGEIRGQLIPGT
jgi:CHRD domain-containing protein